jgi:hypothetical protein
VVNTWQQNYAGITSSEQVEQGAAKVQPKNVDAITTKMDSDAAATDQTGRVMQVLQNARAQQVAGGPLVSKTGIQSLIDAGLVSEEASSNPMIAQAEVTELLRLGPDEVRSRMASDVAAEVEVDETPVFTSVRGDTTTETPVFSTVRDTDTTGDTIVELDETPVFTSVRGDTTTDTDEGVTVELEDDSDAQGELDLVQVEDRKTTIPAVTSTKPETTTATDKATDTTTDTDTTTEVKVLTETGDYPEPEEEEEPEVEVTPETEVTTEVDEGIDVLVPPITSTDDDGNTVTECPEGYEMVETPDGPMCQKSVSSTRQRAGASTRAYTGLAGNVGRRGPGQKRKTTTSTQRVRPTIRSA